MAFRLRGRQVQIDTMAGQLDALQAGRGGIILVRGLPGMGKSSLLAAYTAVGAERDAARVRRLLRARGLRPASGGPRSSREWPELTESEFAVTSLVALGATNREAAERLYLSPYTVNSHLRHVFAKLGIRSRVDLARIAAERRSSG